jgi:hypothetical protein
VSRFFEKCQQSTVVIIIFIGLGERIIFSCLSFTVNDLQGLVSIVTPASVLHKHPSGTRRI